MYNKYLETFIEVANAGSFTKVSDKLMLSPTAIMKQINMLENDLDIKLFNRSHQGLTLTNSGKIIYEASKKIIDFSNKETKKAKEQETKENHTIIIGTSLVCPCKPLIDIWYKIKDKHPEYKIKIVPFEEEHTNTLIKLKNKQTTFDCIVTPCDSKTWLKEVNFLKLGDTNYNITVPLNHKLSNKKIITFKDLSNQTIMISEKGDSKTINKLRNDLIKNAKNIKIEPVPFFYDIDVFNKCSEEGNILMSLDFWKNVHPALKTIPLKEKYKISYGVVYSKNPNKSLKNFIKLIEKNS